MYAERPPAPDLAARIACRWQQVAESDTVQLVVPDACVDLIWGPGGLFVAGPDTGPMPARMAAGERYAGIRFRPGAASGVFGVPLHTLRDQRVPLADLPAATYPGFTSLLSTTTPTTTTPTTTTPDPATDTAMLAVMHAALDTAIRTRLGRAISPSPVAPVAPAIPTAPAVPIGPNGPTVPTARTVRTARTAPTAPAAPVDPAVLVAPVDPAAPIIARALRTGRSVAEVAWDLGLSERQLHRRSVAAFGYAPKTLQRIVRFQRALCLARAGVPLATVAVRAGYTDQAHLSHDVKRLSGVPLRTLAPPLPPLPSAVPVR
ncbi:DUF6597 domain-containing transcriptional factor [Nonomuraea sp. NPDC050783]|uniref:DUF6597 domain-containing transcriptional factor n=1 Tax=Nonomuraea sp. NPDC050783 TaxID=3154634 RepID=UPI003465149D